MKKQHILVVEDDAEMRETLSDILSEEGYEVKTTGESREALAIAREEKEKFPFAICLIDLKLPDIDGIGVLEEIKHINPGTYAIIITAFASKETAIEALKAGAYSYIEKPVNMDELLHVIKRASDSYLLQEEKKQAEDKIRELAEIHTDLRERAPVAIVNVYEDYHINCTDRLLEWTGWSREEVSHINLVKESRFTNDSGEEVVLPPLACEETREKTEKEYIPKLIRGETLDGVYQCYNKKDGGKVDLELNSVGYFGGKEPKPENFEYTICIFTNITERKRAEDALRESEERYRTLVDTSPDAITITDLEGRITGWNKGAEVITGYKEEEVLGKPILPFYQESEHKKAEEMFAEAKEKGVVRNVETRIFNKKRELVDINISLSLLRDSKGEPVASVGISKDITEHKRMDEELERYTKELERANRDLEDFTSTVSHDLRAPLRTIQAFSLLLMEDYADTLDETGRGYLNRVKEGVEGMNALIEDLLKLSRVGRKFIGVETVDLNELLEEIKTDLSARIEEQGGEVVAGKLPSISTQRVWMKQLLTNLIDNGLKFNKSDKPTVEVSCEEQEKDYLFRVKDNGIGIEEKYQHNIFNLFEKLNSQSEYEGTGTGLAICKKIVEKLGGALWVESKPGEGSTFCFTIPRN